jgi:hypothetical protein
MAYDILYIHMRYPIILAMQYDLTIREARILESEPFLELAKKLQRMKLSLEDALPWIETINEVAQIQNMDIKSAGVLVAQELIE